MRTRLRRIAVVPCSRWDVSDPRPRTMCGDRVAPCRGRDACGVRLGAMLWRRATMCSGRAAPFASGEACYRRRVATGQSLRSTYRRRATMFSDRVAFDQSRAGSERLEEGSFSSLCLIDVKTPLF